MTKLIVYPLEHEGSVTVEAEDAFAQKDLRRAARGGISYEQASTTFDDAVKSVKPMTNTIIHNLTDTGANQVVVEFGLKLNGGLDFIVAKASAEANFKVTLKWDLKNETDGKAG